MVIEARPSEAAPRAVAGAQRELRRQPVAEDFFGAGKPLLLYSRRQNERGGHSLNAPGDEPPRGERLLAMHEPS